MTVNSVSIIWKGRMETRYNSRQKESVNLLKEFEGNKWRSVLLTRTKLKLSVCMIKHPAMKTYRRRRRYSSIHS